LTEESLPDLDFAIESPLFPEIDAELFVVLQRVSAIEHQLPQIKESERQRLAESELDGINDEYEYQAISRWIDEFVEEKIKHPFVVFIIHFIIIRDFEIGIYSLPGFRVVALVWLLSIPHGQSKLELATLGDSDHNGCAICRDLRLPLCGFKQAR